jgi:hypothetical protein
MNLKGNLWLRVKQLDCAILYTYKHIFVNDGMKLLLILLFVVKYVNVITTRVVRNIRVLSLLAKQLYIVLDFKMAVINWTFVLMYTLNLSTIHVN